MDVYFDKRECDILHVIKSIVLGCIAEEYAELNGYKRNQDGMWIEREGNQL